MQCALILANFFHQQLVFEDEKKSPEKLRWCAFYLPNFSAQELEEITRQITRQILEVLRVDFDKLYNYFLPHSFFPYFHYPAYR